MGATPAPIQAHARPCAPMHAPGSSQRAPLGVVQLPYRDRVASTSCVNTSFCRRREAIALQAWSEGKNRYRAWYWFSYAHAQASSALAHLPVHIEALQLLSVLVGNHHVAVVAVGGWE